MQFLALNLVPRGLTGTPKISQLALKAKSINECFAKCGPPNIAVMVNTESRPEQQLNGYLFLKNVL
jgi:hypothetical protein